MSWIEFLSLLLSNESISMSKSETSDDGISAGVVVGSVLGVGALVTALLGYCCCRRGHSRNSFVRLASADELEVKIYDDSRFNKGFFVDNGTGAEVGTSGLRLLSVNEPALVGKEGLNDAGYPDDWDPSADDIAQSSIIGNCWMMSAILTLIDNNKQNSLKECFINHKTFLADGRSRFRFYKLNFRFVSCNPLDWSAEINVDSPVEIKIDNTVIGEGRSKIWVKLLEKAFAAFRAGGHIQSDSWVRSALEDAYHICENEKIDIRTILTGGHPCIFRAAVTGIREEHKWVLKPPIFGNRNKILKILRDYSTSRIPLSFSFPANATYTDCESETVAHLDGGHAYSFIRYDEGTQVVYFRDPYSGATQKAIAFNDFYKKISKFIFGCKFDITAI